MNKIEEFDLTDLYKDYPDTAKMLKKMSEKIKGLEVKIEPIVRVQTLYTEEHIKLNYISKDLIKNKIRKITKDIEEQNCKGYISDNSLCYAKWVLEDLLKGE